MRKQTYDEIWSKSKVSCISLTEAQWNVTNYECEPSLFSFVFTLWYDILSFCLCLSCLCSQLLFFCLFLLGNTENNDFTKLYCFCSCYLSALFTWFNLFESGLWILQACEPSGRSLFQISNMVISLLNYFYVSFKWYCFLWEY